MSKKTKSAKKKHQFKHSQPTAAAVLVTEKSRSDSQEPMVVASRKAEPVAASATLGRTLVYLPVDLRRIAMFAVGLMAAEFLLWYLFSQTGVGPAVYSLIKV